MHFQLTVINATLGIGAMEPELRRGDSLEGASKKRKKIWVFGYNLKGYATDSWGVPPQEKLCKLDLGKCGKIGIAFQSELFSHGFCKNSLWSRMGAKFPQDPKLYPTPSLDRAILERLQELREG